MVYSDLIFLLAIFPASVLISSLDSSAEFKNLILIITSLIFFSWGRPFAVCLIFLTVIVDWATGLLLKKNEKNKVLRDILLTADLIVNAGIFLVFAHNGIFSENSFLSLSDRVIPIGIAFYALRGFSYAYDVYKGNIKAEKNFFCLLTYMTSFHLMLAGPLVRYGEIEPYIRKRTITGSRLNSGLNGIVIGLAKVVLLAPAFEKVKLAGLNGNEITILGCWLGMMAFFAQYYFLFTGFADMGKGLGLTNGFEYPDNYKDIEAKGLFSGMVTGFNCTVTKFFTELFGLDRERGKSFTIICSAICGGVIGFWYKASFSTVMAGILAGLLCSIEKIWLSKKLEKLPAVIKYIYMGIFALLIFGLIYFDGFYGYRKWLFALIGVGSKYTLSVAVKYAVLKNITLILISAIIVLPYLKNLLLKAVVTISEKNARLYGIVRISQTVLTAAVYLLCIFTLTVAAL